MAMRRVCAWCKLDMGIAPGEDGKVTHCICETCEAKFFAELDPQVQLRDEPDPKIKS